MTIDPEAMQAARLQIAAELQAAHGWTSSWDHQLAVNVARGDYKPTEDLPGTPAPCPRLRAHGPHSWTDGGPLKACPGTLDDKETASA